MQDLERQYRTLTPLARLQHPLAQEIAGMLYRQRVPRRAVHSPRQRSKAPNTRDTSLKPLQLRTVGETLCATSATNKKIPPPDARAQRTRKPAQDRECGECIAEQYLGATPVWSSRRGHIGSPTHSPARRVMPIAPPRRHCSIPTSAWPAVPFRWAECPAVKARVASE